MNAIEVTARVSFRHLFQLEISVWASLLERIPISGRSMKLDHIATAICVALAMGLFSEHIRQYQLLPAAVALQVRAAHENVDVRGMVGSIGCRVSQSIKASEDQTTP
jgi:hypothetical protein